MRIIILGKPNSTESNPKIVDAPFYVSNLNIRTDLKIPFVYESRKKKKKKKKLYASAVHRPNSLVSLSQKHPSSKPYSKRYWLRDLLGQ
jgi:hypothetical protein